MSIKKFYESICTSELFCLTLNGSIVGMRAKVYNRERLDYDYYDFATSLISDNNIKSFLKSNRAKFSSLPLVSSQTEKSNPDGTITVTTLMMTEDEIKNNRKILEFKTKEEAEKVLNEVISVYKVKEI